MALAWELDWVSLPDAVRLTLLCAVNEPGRYEQMARRWLARLLDEVGPTLRDYAVAAEVVAGVAGGTWTPDKANGPLTRAVEGKRLG